MWESTGQHHCWLPLQTEVNRVHAGQGAIWVCKCGLRWRLVINVNRGSWFCLDNEDKRWIGEI